MSPTSCSSIWFAKHLLFLKESKHICSLRSSGEGTAALLFTAFIEKSRNGGYDERVANGSWL